MYGLMTSISNHALVSTVTSYDVFQSFTFDYSSTFVLAWIVLPIQMEYHNSGQFNFSEKVRQFCTSHFRLRFAAIIQAPSPILKFCLSNILLASLPKKC